MFWKCFFVSLLIWHSDVEWTTLMETSGRQEQNIQNKYSTLGIKSKTSYFVTLISYKQWWMHNKAWNIVFFLFLHIKYTPYVPRVPGDPTVHQAERKKHCPVAAFICLLLLKIGLRYDLSYPAQASCMYHHNSIIIFFILNVPYKKQVVVMHILFFTVSVEHADSEAPEP